LGEHKYSSFIRTINNKPFFIDPTKYKYETQVLSSRLIETLGINSYMINDLPLHLHLNEINMAKKFKKQKYQITIQAPVLPYFTETLNRFGLKFNRNLELNK
jgi:hypothetical protein